MSLLWNMIIPDEPAEERIGDEVVNEAVASGDDAGTTVSHPSGDEVVNENLGRGRRSHKPSVLLRDFVT